MTAMGTPVTPIRVALVNDYEIIVKGLQSMLLPYSDRVLVVELDPGTLPSKPADIALFDTFAGRRHSLERIGAMAKDVEIGKVVLYTWDAPAAFLADIQKHNIDAIITKAHTGEALVSALERIHAGERMGLEEATEGESSNVLSEREREVLSLLAIGLTNREIANELYLSVDTVKTYLRGLFRKLGVSNRTQAAVEAANFQLSPPAGRRRGSEQAV
jgi:DNA-binding NarL/FixJ family response regulator